MRANADGERVGAEDKKQGKLAKDGFSAQSFSGKGFASRCMNGKMRAPVFLQICLMHNTEVCESTNAWLAGFKHAVRHMHQFSFKFHLATNMDLHNEILSAGAGSHMAVCRPVRNAE